jgi:hypothetical protein
MDNADVPQVQPGELAPHEPVPRILKDAFKLWKGRGEPLIQGRAEVLKDLAAVGVKRNDISAQTLCDAVQSFQASLGLDGGSPVTFPELSDSQFFDSYSLTDIPGRIPFPIPLGSPISNLLAKLVLEPLTNV